MEECEAQSALEVTDQPRQLLNETSDVNSALNVWRGECIVVRTPQQMPASARAPIFSSWKGEWSHAVVSASPKVSIGAAWVSDAISSSGKAGCAFYTKAG